MSYVHFNKQNGYKIKRSKIGIVFLIQPFSHFITKHSRSSTFRAVIAWDKLQRISQRPKINNWPNFWENRVIRGGFPPATSTILLCTVDRANAARQRTLKFIDHCLYPPVNFVLRPCYLIRYAHVSFMNHWRNLFKKMLHLCFTPPISLDNYTIFDWIPFGTPITHR